MLATRPRVQATLCVESGGLNQVARARVGVAGDGTGGTVMGRVDSDAVPHAGKRAHERMLQVLKVSDVFRSQTVGPL